MKPQAQLPRQPEPVVDPQKDAQRQAQFKERYAHVKEARAAHAIQVQELEAQRSFPARHVENTVREFIVWLHDTVSVACATTGAAVDAGATAAVDVEVTNQLLDRVHAARVGLPYRRLVMEGVMAYDMHLHVSPSTPYGETRGVVRCGAEVTVLAEAYLQTTSRALLYVVVPSMTDGVVYGQFGHGWVWKHHDHPSDPKDSVVAREGGE